MATYIKGFYYLIDGEQIVTTRYVQIADEKDDPFASLHAAACRDPMFLHLKDPSVGVLIDPPAVGSYTLGFTIDGLVNGMDGLHVENINVGSQCGNCRLPLAEYTTMLKNSIFQCPYCKSCFTHVTPHSLDRAALSKRMAQPKWGHAYYFMLDFKLPFGYPIPAKLPGPLVKTELNKVLTEHDDLAVLIPEYILAKGK